MEIVSGSDFNAILIHSPDLKGMIFIMETGLNIVFQIHNKQTNICVYKHRFAD
jgi:hypothetical protein